MRGRSSNTLKRASLRKSRSDWLSWETTVSLLFLGAPGYRIASQDLDNLKQEFAGLNVETSQSVLKQYQLRKQAAAAISDERRLPQLHTQ
jgi:hypothetical protein